jgi:hypothetical protein
MTAFDGSPQGEIVWRAELDCALYAVPGATRSCFEKLGKSGDNLRRSNGLATTSALCCKVRFTLDNVTRQICLVSRPVGRQANRACQPPDRARSTSTRLTCLSCALTQERRP